MGLKLAASAYLASAGSYFFEYESGGCKGNLGFLLRLLHAAAYLLLSVTAFLY